MQPPLLFSEDICYEALRSRDPRFATLFVVGVATTGIYCRPGCPARTPARSGCRFFPTPAEAARAGYIACRRCRPQLPLAAAPLERIRNIAYAAAEGIAALVYEVQEEGRGVRPEVGSRHLRRAMVRELGFGPAELERTLRLTRARSLLRETNLSVAEVALGSGYGSVRRFNEAFRKVQGHCPSRYRLEGPGEEQVLTCSVPYHSPLAWQELLAYLAPRAIAGVEEVEGDRYRRTVSVEGYSGWLEVSPGPPGRLWVRAAARLAPVIGSVIRRVRALFDLDADPAPISHALGPLAEQAPGLRLPGAFSFFEAGARVILAQQVSVAAAAALAGRLVEHCGSPCATPFAGLCLLPPDATRLASATLPELRATGISDLRARALKAFAAWCTATPEPVRGVTHPVELRLRLLAIPGVGPWSIEMILMRGVGWPDAFPASDLALCRTLECAGAAAAEQVGAAWRPWRAYAAQYLWQCPPDAGWGQGGRPWRPLKR